MDRDKFISIKRNKKKDKQKDKFDRYGKCTEKGVRIKLAKQHLSTAHKKD